jgi:NAD(P)-dependent dehydrogenase (short-subunit alcohol dehydrogenase family)
VRLFAIIRREHLCISSLILELVYSPRPYFTVQKLAPLMTEGSSVVFTTSLANVKGMPNLSAYGAAKAALRSLTRSIAPAFAPRGIRVNAVSPGPIASTDILQKIGMPKDASEQVYLEAVIREFQREGLIVLTK